MAKPDHPAAKAGRLVRMVGLGVAKEIEKRSAPPANATSAAATQPSPAQTPPPPIPNQVHPAAKAGRIVRLVGLGLAKELDKRADAPPKSKPAPLPPPPPIPTRGLAGRLIFATWFASLAAAVLVIIHAEKTVPGHEPKLVLETALTVILGAGSGMLLLNWGNARGSLIQRLLTRAWGPRGPMNRREKAFARILGERFLIFGGILLLAAAVFELLVALGWSDVNNVGA